MADEKTPIEADENHLIAERRGKLERLRGRGVAFPNDFRRDSTAEELHVGYGGHAPEWFDAHPTRVTIAGRMMFKRVMGKASFAKLKDRSGLMQVFLQSEALGALYDEFKAWDVGELPDKWHGLADVESRYRQRYVDLIVNDDSRAVFRARNRIVQFLRSYLEALDFMEVETPMMQVIPGGAAARPFMTHHNALDVDMYLRIAPELYLKRLVVGGFERVYELNRNFRNEGLSTQHNPEFTMLELYQAYADYRDLMDMVERIFQGVADTVCGTRRIEYQGETIDLGSAFRRVTVEDLVVHFTPGFERAKVRDLEYLRGVCERLGVAVNAADGAGKLQIEIFEKTGEHELRQPTFVYAYPAEVSPLARRNDNDPFITDRFEFFIGGRELANGFSELNDPDDQAARFREQVARKSSGDEEAMFYDADYVRALEYGLPPTAGLGIGVDRMVMLFTNQPSIRDVLLFPHMRPERESD